MKFFPVILLYVSCAALPLFGLTIAGQEYLPLSTAATNLGMQIKGDSEGKEIQMHGVGGNVELSAKQRVGTINGTRVWLNYPVAEYKNNFYISKLDHEKTLVPLLRPQAFSLAHYRLRHIVLDAGHGGKDTGARNPKLRINEKTFTIDVAQRVKQRLEALGYRVTMTRSDDHFVELKDRPRLANTLRADLFVSIHFNAAGPAITGVETYSYTPQGAPSSSRAEAENSDNDYQPSNRNDIASLWAAYEVQRAVAAGLRTPDRAARHARYVVLESLKCPGILVEGGYITSPSEGSRLSSSLYRQQLANAIVDGIRGYHRRLLGM